MHCGLMDFPATGRTAFCRARLGHAPGLLVFLARCSRRRVCAHPRAIDRAPCLHRLVGISRRPYSQQYQRIRFMTGRSVPMFVITFAVAYAVLYVVSVEYNLALFTYHPVTEEFHFLVKPASEGPAMYWYGWLATSGLSAFAIAALASWLPKGPTNRLWSNCSWSVPLAVMVVFVYILRRYFIR